MAIRVICPGCHKRFQVSDKFAGQTGACPNCKHAIRVPSKDEEVTVHAPEAFEGGGRGISGKLTLKPIARRETRLAPVAIVGIAAAALITLFISWIAGSVFQESLLLRVAGLLIVSPPLVLAGYGFLHNDDDLEPFSGMTLLSRAGLCALAYVLLWGIFSYVSGHVLTGELWSWFLVAPPLLAMGALAGLAFLDLDFGSAFLLYSFYVLVTVVLGWLAGLGWIWEIQP